MSFENTAVLDALLNTEIEVTREVEVPRFGMFTLRALTMKEINRLRKQATNLVGAGKGKTVENIDEENFAALLVAKSCVSPDWSTPALLSKMNAETPEDAISKRLLAGELSALSSAVMDVSGFDMDTLTGKAKN